MTLGSPVRGVPLPNDATELLAPNGLNGWTTTAATVEELTAWYRGHLTHNGWRLVTEYSVLDPLDGEARGLGHATSAIYCSGDDLPTIAVNIGRSLNEDAASTVVLAITVAPQSLDCA